MACSNDYRERRYFSWLLEVINSYSELDYKEDYYDTESEARLGKYYNFRTMDNCPTGAFYIWGTIVFCEDDFMRPAFLLIILIGSLLTSSLNALIRKRSYQKSGQEEVIIDERERLIRRRSDIVAGLWGFTTVVFGVLGLFIYGEHTGGTVPAYSLFFPLLVGTFVYLISHGIYTLVLCNRKISYNED